MLLSSTKREPAHYMLKIDSFSILSEAGYIKIESDVFEASGHKWRLDVYPNGQADEAVWVFDHVSLYLVLCDNTDYRSKGWEVHVDVKFFVYNHVDRKYITFQDGKGTKFHEKQMKWGFDKLISLEHFNNSSRGYLFNDSCVFGAEVFPLPEYTLKDRCLSMIKPPAFMNTHSWTVDNFSTITEKCLTSEVFKVGNVKWILSLYPKGETGKSTFMSIFLHVHEAALFPVGWRIYAKYELRVKNQLGYADEKIESSHWFCKSTPGVGYLHFMQLSELCHMNRGFLVNDTLITEAKISVIGLLKNFI